MEIITNRIDSKIFSGRSVLYSSMTRQSDILQIDSGLGAATSRISRFDKYGAMPSYQISASYRYIEIIHKKLTYKNLRLGDPTCRSLIFNASDHQLIQIART
jgi:hypothetical protein